MTLFGWDASDYDWSRGPMDLNAAKAAGITFFTHKSTEHASNGVFKHTHYGEALTRARAAGIPYYGTYIVPRSGVAVQTQIDTAVAYLDAQTPWWRTDPRFFLQVDLEKWPYDSVSDSIGEDMTRKLRTAFGKKVLLYGSQGMYGTTIDADMSKWNANYPNDASAKSRDYRDVYAAVGGDSGRGWVAYGANNTPAVIWQYASDSTIGTQPTCDANAFRGTLAEFAALVSADNSLPVITPPVTTPPAVKPAVAYPGDGHPIERWPNVKLDAIGEKIARVWEYYPRKSELYFTSGMDGDHGASSWHYANLSYQGSRGAALDVGAGGVTPEGSRRMRDAAKWLYDQYAYLVEEIHTTPYADDQGFYVKNQVRNPGGSAYGAATMAAHANHIHSASTDALLNQLLAKLDAQARAAGATQTGDDNSVGTIDNDMTNLPRVQINNAEHYLQALIGLADAAAGIGNTVATDTKVPNALAALLRTIAADVAAVKARPAVDVSALATDPAFRDAVVAAVRAEIRDAVADLGEGGAERVRSDS